MHSTSTIKAHTKWFQDSKEKDENDSKKTNKQMLFV